MPDSQIRIATIGSWGHFGQVLSELTTIPHAKLVAHARSLPEDHPDQIRRDPAVPWHEDYRQMLKDIRPDVVVISTRLDRINPIAIEAAEARCHLICEKPLALEHDALAKLYEACITNKRQCIAMLGNAQNPAVLAAAGILQSGEAGQTILLNARKSYKWGTRPEWFGDHKCYGDTIGWIAIHSLDTIHALTGQSFVSVAAMESNRAHPDRPDCQDNGVLMLALSGGLHASASFDFLRPRAASTHGDSWVRVVGSKGVIEAHLDQNWCKFASDDSPETQILLPPPGPYYRSFLDELSGECPSREMRRAFMLTHVCLCARDAAREKAMKIIPRGAWDL